MKSRWLEEGFEKRGIGDVTETKCRFRSGETCDSIHTHLTKYCILIAKHFLLTFLLARQAVIGDVKNSVGSTAAN